jgi:hypothetical protein
VTVQERVRTQEPGAAAPVSARRRDPGRSKITGAIRLVLAIWLMVDGLMTLGALLSQPEPGTDLGAVLRVAGLHFALGVFFLSGFMSRIGGLVLVALGIAEAHFLGLRALDVAMVLGGAYMFLRGGGAWAMDLYVEKMQDRVRLRQAREAEERRRASLSE